MHSLCTQPAAATGNAELCTVSVGDLCTQPHVSKQNWMKHKGKGGKKRQPKSWWARPSSPGFSAWCHPSLLGACATSEEADKSQRPQGHHTDHVPNRGTRKTATCSIFTGLYSRYRREGTEVHVSPEVPTPTEAPGAQLSSFPRETGAPPRTPSLRQPHFCA